MTDIQLDSLFISRIYQTITYIELFPFFCHSWNSCEFCKLLKIQPHCFF